MLKQMVKGVATGVPGLSQFFCRGTGGTSSARYCYSVWLRHLVLAHESNLNSCPKVVAELGPGDSLGIGLAALISGSEKYYAFDIVKHAEIEKNLGVFDEIVELFKSKADIPGPDEFPQLNPWLNRYDFPEDIFTKDRLDHSLSPERIEMIRHAIKGAKGSESLIQYKAPWDDLTIVRNDSVDMIYSQAVLEHVDQLVHAYKAMYLWLNKDGFMSHQVDFKCHGTAKEWNGHWYYSDFVWKVIRGKRPYMINREPCSTHKRILEECRFRIICEEMVTKASNIKKDKLASRFKKISDEDLVTSGVFYQAIKD